MVRFESNFCRSSVWLLPCKSIFKNLEILEKGGKSSWIGDGTCDDINNNYFCKFDGGDCCGPNVRKNYCMECKCLETTCTVNRDTGEVWCENQTWRNEYKWTKLKCYNW